MQSANEGRPARTAGSTNSLMAGLACGEVSDLAWRFLEHSADFFVTIADADALAAMSALAFGSHGDIPIVGGESGVAGYAALVALCEVEAHRKLVGLGPNARVLLVNTEGDTAPKLYENLIGCTAAAVLASQAIWKDGAP